MIYGQYFNMPFCLVFCSVKIISLLRKQVPSWPVWFDVILIFFGFDSITFLLCLNNRKSLLNFNVLTDCVINISSQTLGSKHLTYIISFHNLWIFFPVPFLYLRVVKVSHPFIRSIDLDFFKRFKKRIS